MRVAIAGGGVIGLSVAWRAAARGHEVIVVDPAPGSGASWVAAGMLAPVAEAYQGEEAITTFGVAAARRWESWAGELASASGIDPGYSRHGTLVVARDQDELAALLPLHDVQTAQGLHAERVSSREARRLEPALTPTVRGGLWLADDHQVDNRRYLEALHGACDRSDVGFVAAVAERCRKDAIVVADGTTIGADAVVVATGADVPVLEIAGEVVSLPIRPVKGQIVRVRATSNAVFPVCTLRADDVYIVPRDDGEIAIGATSEDKGFDQTVTAGAVRELLTSAWELVPGLAEAEFVEAVAGSRPGTPDNAPLIGRSAPDGPVLAMGHYRHGVLFSPATADAVVAVIEGDTTSDVVAPFSPARFSEVAA